MEAQDQGAGHAAEDAEGQASPGNAGNTGGPGGQDNPGRNSSGEAPNPGPGGNALLGPATTTIRRRRLQLYPFQGVAGRGRGTGRRPGWPGVGSEERRWGAGDPGGLGDGVMADG